MSIKILSEYIQEGIVMLNYYLLYSLDLHSAIVLSQIIAEYNHANKYKLNAQQYFLTNIQRMSDYLNLDNDEIICALKDLQNLYLIDFCSSGIKNTCLVVVNEDKIINFVRQTKQEYMLHKWDWGLINAQNPKGQATSFNDSTKALMTYVNENMYNPEKIPMVIYSFCNMQICSYESNGNNFLEIHNLANKVITCIQDRCFKPFNLALLVQDICKE